MKRYVFTISDGTGITAENFASSLMAQFEQIDLHKQSIPYIDTVSKAEQIVSRINDYYHNTKVKPLVFMTIVNQEVAECIKQAKGCVFDLFNTFLGPMEVELQTKSSYRVGKTHGVSDNDRYAIRIEAVDYALAHDDGVKVRGYEKADIILVGVSRSGKTPSCIYMALHFGIMAANYPFTDDDLVLFNLPESLKPYKSKLFGLTIDPERLQHIRHERRPNSQYSSIEQCRIEVQEVEAMYRKENIPYLNSTRYSIEEIAIKILSIAGITRKY